MASLNSSRSSAFVMASSVAPIISTPYLSSTPRSARRHGHVQARLAAEGRQQRVGPLAAR